MLFRESFLFHIFAYYVLFAKNTELNEKVSENKIMINFDQILNKKCTNSHQINKTRILQMKEQIRIGKVPALHEFFLMILAKNSRYAVHLANFR